MSKHYSKHYRNTTKTQAQTLKHNVVSGHNSLGRPAPQTQNATKLKQTYPRHTDTQAKRIKTHSKHTKTQPKHSQTQIGPKKKSAEGEGAKHIIIIIWRFASAGAGHGANCPSANKSLATMLARTSLVMSYANFQPRQRRSEGAC